MIEIVVGGMNFIDSKITFGVAVACMDRLRA
jgi:hypothetical protein